MRASLDHLDVLLRSADLHIVEFDIHSRTEMKTFRRVRPWYVMSYHKKGNAVLRVGKETLNIVPGTVILIPPYVEHDHYKEDHEESVFLWCHFTFKIAGSIDALKLFNPPLTFHMDRHEEFEQVFMQYRELRRSSSSVPTVILKRAKELEILYYLLKAAMNRDNKRWDPADGQRFLALLANIVQHPEKEISLKEWSKQLNLHPTYISNRFKELFGKSPIRLQSELKIHKAKTLLQTSEMSVSEIAQSVGFQNVSSFSRMFKTMVGVSPTQYRLIYRFKPAGGREIL